MENKLLKTSAQKTTATKNNRYQIYPFGIVLAGTLSFNLWAQVDKENALLPTAPSEIVATPAGAPAAALGPTGSGPIMLAPPAATAPGHLPTTVVTHKPTKEPLFLKKTATTLKGPLKVVESQKVANTQNELTLEIELIRKQIKQLQESVERLASRMAKAPAAKVTEPAPVTSAKILAPTSVEVKKPSLPVASSEGIFYTELSAQQLKSWYASIWSDKTDEAQKSSQDMIDFAKKHPHDLWSDNIIFWAGDFNYRRKNWDSAISAFQILLDNFPNSHQIPEVLYRLGVIYYQNQDKGNADKVLMRLMDMYPMNRFRMKVKRLMESHQ